MDIVILIKTPDAIKASYQYVLEKFENPMSFSERMTNIIFEDNTDFTNIFRHYPNSQYNLQMSLTDGFSEYAGGNNFSVKYTTPNGKNFYVIVGTKENIKKYLKKISENIRDHLKELNSDEDSEENSECYSLPPTDSSTDSENEDEDESENVNVENPMTPDVSLSVHDWMKGTVLPKIEV